MTSPTKPPTDTRRIIMRGGCLYGEVPGYVRPAYRSNRYLPGQRTTDFGFRTAQTGCHQPILKVQP